VEADRPVVGYCTRRPVPFAVRPAVREQVVQMVSDDILGISNSLVLNPLTAILWEGKKPWICVDIHKVILFVLLNYGCRTPL
jgi:hypothetical protein